MVIPTIVCIRFGKHILCINISICKKGGEVAQWYSALLKNEGPRVRASPASLRCVPLSLLSTGSTQEDRPHLTERLLMGRKESYQTKTNM